MRHSTGKTVEGASSASLKAIGMKITLICESRPPILTQEEQLFKTKYGAKNSEDGVALSNFTPNKSRSSFRWETTQRSYSFNKYYKTHSSWMKDCHTPLLAKIPHQGEITKTESGVSVGSGAQLHSNSLVLLCVIMQILGSKLEKRLHFKDEQSNFLSTDLIMIRKIL